MRQSKILLIIGIGMIAIGIGLIVGSHAIGPALSETLWDDVLLYKDRIRVLEKELREGKEIVILARPLMPDHRGISAQMEDPNGKIVLNVEADVLRETFIPQKSGIYKLSLQTIEDETFYVEVAMGNPYLVNKIGDSARSVEVFFPYLAMNSFGYFFAIVGAVIAFIGWIKIDKNETKINK